MTARLFFFRPASPQSPVLTQVILTRLLSLVIVVPRAPRGCIKLGNRADEVLRIFLPHSSPSCSMDFFTVLFSLSSSSNAEDPAASIPTEEETTGGDNPAYCVIA
ncbi:hypothetical protein P691DRAFT_803402 [Macrolepiota fuliginosa MF-IS2]|uniref:Pheromone n=1 Tax=Macrolepiota fuliginosa MF-IS2 TaxID=1400762 RepID=A0A9P5X9V9_9AGAR|nr:hypothetical protein P691DRAFT_803402 [Macrolepiota fuliginosa MF-IS2]